jgi:hypothetical protein
MMRRRCQMPMQDARDEDEDEDEDEEDGRSCLVF